MPLAFAPVGWAWLAMIALAAFFALTAQSSKRQVLWSAYLFGLGYFGVGVSWVFISISQNCFPSLTRFSSSKNVDRRLKPSVDKVGKSCSQLTTAFTPGIVELFSAHNTTHATECPPTGALRSVAHKVW